MATFWQNSKINGFTLKLIAVISMLIDHSAACVLEKILYSAQVVNFPFIYEHWESFRLLYLVMRGIGRLAFPIYCFLIVEGLFYTKSVKKYAFRLFLFALLSEVPFDLAIEGTVWDFSYNNVYFTLFIGLVVIAVLKWMYGKWKEPLAVRLGEGAAGAIYGFAVAVIGLLGMLLAEYALHTDYGAAGVLCILIMFLSQGMMRDVKSDMGKWRAVIGFAVAVISLAVFSNILELAALVAVVPVFLYNGRRGKQLKYFFYAFYPVHLLLLYLLLLIVTVQ